MGDLVGRHRRSWRSTSTGVLVLAAIIVAALLWLRTGDEDAEPIPAATPTATSLPAADQRLGATQALLSGTVTDERTKLPLAGAALSIDQAGGRLSATADGDGHYLAVIDVTRPIAITVDALHHRGTVIFGKLCPGERRTLSIELPAAEPGTPPPSPVIIGGDC